MGFEPGPLGPDRRVAGPRPPPAAARSLRRLMLAGVAIPPQFTGARPPTRSRRAIGGRMSSARSRCWCCSLRRRRHARAVAAAGGDEPQRGAGRRGQAGVGETTGRSLVPRARCPLPPHGERAAARRLAGRGGRSARPSSYRARDRVLAARLGRAEHAVRAARLALVVAIGGSILIARALIERRRGQRSEAFVEQLPEIARMLANGAAAGLSMPQALGTGLARARRPRRSRARRVVDELRVGQSRRGRAARPARPGCRRARSRC